MSPDVEAKIAEAREKRSKVLDLGNCDLTELPPSVLDLDQLEVLVLGAWYYDEHGRYCESKNVGEKNHIDSLPDLKGALPSLTSLHLAWGLVWDASPLRELIHLTVLDLSCNGLSDSDLASLRELTALTDLNLSYNSISDVSALRPLTALTKLNLQNNNVSDVSALRELTRLDSLNLSHNQLSEASSLQGLTSLTKLFLSGNDLSAVEVLSELTALTEVDLSGNQIADVSSLQALTSLTRLHLSGNRVSEVESMQNLTALTDLDVRGNRLADVSLLQQLTNLTNLDLAHNRLGLLPRFVLDFPNLKRLTLFGNPIVDLPSQALGMASGTNCLADIRTCVSDNAFEPKSDHEVKLILLGNGGVGKTSLVERLMRNRFVEKESTHGISLERWSLLINNGLAEINVWDFGGQDIYHGTHSLFLRSQAIFLILWDVETEQQELYPDCDLMVRNQPLRYWLDYVQALSPDSPVIVVQNKSDRDRRCDPPCPTRGAQTISVDAKSGTNREALLAMIRELCEAEQRKTAQYLKDLGQFKVKWILRAKLTLGKPEDRIISLETYLKLCQEEGSAIPSPMELLHFLHRCGAVFYQEELFENQILLNQKWAIDAIYQLFERKHCYPQLVRAQGKFHRSDLNTWAWRDALTDEEQKLLISFMESCGICFPIVIEACRQDSLYLVPAALPAREDSSITRDREHWHRFARQDERFRIHYKHLLIHSGIFQQFQAVLGTYYGESATYWRDGIMLEDRALDAFAELNCRQSLGAGEIRVEVWGPGWQELFIALQTNLEAMLTHIPDLSSFVSHDGKSWVDVAHLNRYAVHGILIDTDGNAVSIEPYRFLLPQPGITEPEPPEPEPPEPIPESEVYFSYAWNDETDPDRETVVDEAYAELERSGYNPIRDKAKMTYKDRISDFIQEIGRGQCIVVVLSDKYYRSPYCMAELVAIYECSRRSSAEFLRRVCPIRLEDPSLANADTYADFWAGRRDHFADRYATRTKRGEFGDAGHTDLKAHQEIVRYCHDLISFLSDALQITPEKLRQDNFAILKNAIRQCLNPGEANE